MGHIYHTSILPKLRDNFGRVYKSQRVWMTTAKQLFLDPIGLLSIWTHRSCNSMHKNCGSSFKPGKNPWIEGKVVTSSGRATENDSCWKRENLFLKAVFPDSWTRSSRWPHTQEYIVRQVKKNENTRLGRYEMRSELGWGWGWRRVNVIKIKCIKFSNWNKQYVHISIDPDT